jgi:hypothetical protein
VTGPDTEWEAGAGKGIIDFDRVSEVLIFIPEAVITRERVA